MSIQISINVDESFERVKEVFRQFPDKVAPFLRNAAQTAAFAIEREAKIISPVDTGRMRASIATSLGIVGNIAAVVQTNVEYAIYVHEGTKSMRGRPFMKQGADAAMPAIKTAYEENIKKALELLK